MNLRELQSCNIYATEKERLEANVTRYNKMKGNLNNYDGFDCPKCLNRGYFHIVRQVGEIWEIALSDCSCKKSRRSIRNLKASGLEKVLKEYTFDNFVANEDWQKDALNKAKMFANSATNEWFFFGGQSGSGKTHLCTAIAIELLRKGYEVKYMLWKDDSRKIKNDNYEGGNLIDYYKDVDVLYIDDLFKMGRADKQLYQKPTPADINLAFEILNSRVASRKITIISTENTLAELFEIDEATAGRIKDRCGIYGISILRNKDKNFRLKTRGKSK